MSWAAQYVGIPWAEGADGPDAYDCMSFTRMVMAQHFGIEMERVMIPDYDDGIALLGLLNSCGERSNWGPVTTPMAGDIAVVRRPFHVGVWLDTDGGGVLHCVRGSGVVWTAAGAWATSGFGRRTFLRHRSRL